MMRSGRCVALLTVVAVALAASSLFAGARPAKAPPRLSEEQATEKLAAIARTFDVPLDKPVAARFTGSLWILQRGFSKVTMRDDTGQLVEVHRLYATPPPGVESIAKERAIATATRLLKLAGTPADAKLGEARQDGPRWSFSCGRQTPQGVPYDGERAFILIDATGQLWMAFLRWSPAPPPESTEVKVTKEQAVRAAKDFLKRAHRPGSDDEFVSANLWVVQPNDYYSARRPQGAGASTATRVAWAVSFPRPLSGSLTRRKAGRPGPGADWVRDVVWIDAANAEVVGGRTGPTGWPPAEAIQRVIAHRRTRIASATGGIVIAVVAVGLVVRMRRHRRGSATAA